MKLKIPALLIYADIEYGFADIELTFLGHWIHVCGHCPFSRTLNSCLRTLNLPFSDI